MTSARQLELSSKIMPETIYALFYIGKLFIYAFGIMWRESILTISDLSIKVLQHVWHVVPIQAVTF